MMSTNPASSHEEKPRFLSQVGAENPASRWSGGRPSSVRVAIHPPICPPPRVGAGVSVLPRMDSQLVRCRAGSSVVDLAANHQTERCRGGGSEDEVRAQVLLKRLEVVLPDRLVD